MLTATQELCERNSVAENSEHGSQLQFSILNRLINVRVFLRLLRELLHQTTTVFTLLNNLLQITLRNLER
jgi:hypothetical protein